MRFNSVSKKIKNAFHGATVLLLAAGFAHAQQTLNLTAGPTSANLPDGTSVPMWGYTCGTPVPGSTASCSALNPGAASAGLWSPVIITVPTGQSLQINLTNNLVFGPSSSPNNIPTSLVIVGQVGGGLGDGGTSAASPVHDNQGTTWPIANAGPAFTPPAQEPRVQSFSTEVPAGTSTSLTWTSPNPGTYLLESGTHPSIQATMGLVGMVVVTSAPSSTAGTAYPKVSYNSEVPLLFSEIDPAQNFAVNSAVGTAGFKETSVRGNFGGPVSAVKITNGGKNYTVPPTVVFSTGAPSASGTAVIDTDPASSTFGQVTSVSVTAAGVYASAATISFVPNDLTGTQAAAIAIQGNANTIAICSDGAAACYPPVVNYSPRYYLINGSAFDKTNPAASLFAATQGANTGAITGNLLVRMVNAGSRMHVPSIVGSVTGGNGGLTLVAEDGNPLPGVPRIQNEVFMSAGKTYDVLIDVPVGGVSAVNLSGGGAGYTAPMITFSGGGGSGAAAQAVVVGGVITQINVTNPGSGYTSAPTVSIADSGATAVAAATAAITPGFGTYPVFDRQLSLSGNGINRDAGMLAYISVNGAGLGASPSTGAAQANPDSYSIVLPCDASASSCTSASVADPSKGVLANDINVFGAKVVTPPTKGTIALNNNGTFTYTPNPGWAGPDSFMYCGNGAGANTSSSHPCETVTLSSEVVEDAAGITCTAPSYTANVATSLKMSAPGVLANCTDAKGFPLTATNVSGVSSSMTLSLDKTGAFTASVPPGGAGVYNFSFVPMNSQGVKGAAVQVSVTFPQGSGLQVKVVDGNDKTTAISDYRWILEEDRTFYVDPKCTTNPPAPGCPGANGGVVPNFGTNFHTSYMPMIATGCTGDVSCGNNQTVGGVQVAPKAFSSPSDVALCSSVPVGTPCLDPNKRYYISVLPGDAAQPFIAGYTGSPDCTLTGSTLGHCGHGMGGAPIPVTPNGQHDSGQKITVLTEPSPFPPATLTVFVFQDDYPLNGEHDAGGGLDVLAPNEPGLGGFNITLMDNAGGTGDATGTPTYDMFNMPLTNSLAGTLDPVTHQDACPISRQSSDNQIPDPKHPGFGLDGNPLGTQQGMLGQIVTCPKYESDGKTLSPLAGQAVVKNLYPGRYGVVANPGADRIGRGEEWVQTNTLDGQKAHDSFMRIGEPAYFQEFGPAGYHVTIGFANPKIINDRGKTICNAPGADCKHEVKGHVTLARMSRTPDERLYGSGTHDGYAFTQCYVSIGDPDGADFGFTKCDDKGNFDFPTVPAGNWKITTFDQWNDQVVDGITTAVGMCDPKSPIDPKPVTNCKALLDMGEVAVHQWQADIYTRTFLDVNGDGVSNTDAQGKPTEPGLPLVQANIRFRDGSFSNFNNTDLNGYASFNEVFPLFNWYVIETDSTRYKNTGTHVVYDSGGPVDGSSPSGVSCSDSSTTTKPCGKSNIANNLANTYEAHPLPGDLHVPGAVYCNDADCSSQSIADGPNPTATPNSTGRIDPPWVVSEAWQGFSGQGNFLEFGKKQFAEGENGGIRGHVVYASTRPFDDPQFLIQTSWEPLVPHVRVNLYKEGLAADGITQTLTLVDHTETSSFDDWAQGFRRNPDGSFVQDSKGNYIPNMSCPGQGTDDKSDPLADPYYWFALKDQPQWLDVYNNNGSIAHPLAHDSQYKCYDGMHNWNQLQPAPYDGMYSFPSVTSMDPVTGKPMGTNCTGCVANPTVATGSPSDPMFDSYRSGTPMLPAGNYVVEVVVPPGFELVKEEDKNILIGDNFIAPVTQQFGGLGSIFILPDQAAIAEAYNSNNADNATTNLSMIPPSGIDATKTQEQAWPCVGEARVVPDFISLFPGSKEVAPFAGATRHLCDRKEVRLADQTSSLAKFYIFTETHAASHFTGLITDDMQAEFDPYSPAFGEKYAPPYMPVSMRDWAGNEINRVYSDAFGAYDGLNYSTWEVNPPNPTGYGPTMMVMCMNDSGLSTGSSTADPLFHKGYSDFCYELPFMPGQTGYFDTPVVPVSAFAGGNNSPDCSYPDTTPGISTVQSQDIAGPWVSAPGHTLTINSIGDQSVDNFAYTGPQASIAPYNKQTITRHYGFGSAPTDFSKFPALTAPQTYSCSSSDPNAVCPYVTIGGQAMSAVSWSDSQITGSVPSGVPDCAIQQQTQFGGSHASCGQLVVTASNGKQSVDSITVTIGGKTPTLLQAGQTIQNAIDAAAPGDMILVPSGNYSEMLIMWKPLRLQGVGAVSTVIDANPHPAGKLDPWRRQMVCLFGLALNGQPSTGKTGTNPFDPSGTFTCDAGSLKYLSGGPEYPAMAVDRIPLEGILGWDTTVNGNLAEQMIEPGLLGGYEGGGITVLAKGVKIPAGRTDIFGSGAEAAFPDGTVTLTANDCTDSGGSNPYPSNYLCNPSSIDGFSIRNSSQGGGGIYVHAWAHDLQIANNRIYSNHGTMSGGITIGQGEHVEVPLTREASVIPPGSCITPDPNVPSNVALPFCYDMDVNVHNNSVTQNASLGDELFSSTPAGAGGVTFCNGSDYYKFNYNWVCGNMSTGDGAGVVHLGFSYDGDISHNTILFNQSSNPTIATNGGGLLVMGAPDPDPPCSESNDQDCVPTSASVPPSDGVGPGLVINANLIQGNSADAGSGGGIRLQHVNGMDVIHFPNGQISASNGNPTQQIWPDIKGHTENADAFANAGSMRRSQALTKWNSVTITNNIISNNVAGWDGGGVSLLDALAVNFVNNTVSSNNSTASAGVLFQTLFAPLASTHGENCTTTLNGNANKGSCPQPAGLVAVPNTAILTANMELVPGGMSSFVCPSGNGANGTAGDCTKFSVPNIANDVFWQNRSFMIGEGPLGNGQVNQQTVVSIYNPGFGAQGVLNPTLTANQIATGSCNDANASYWDIGVRGDVGPGDHSSGGTLAPAYSVLTNAAGALAETGNGSNNLLNPATAVKSTYCNGSRSPVESGGAGWLVPPGTNESNALPAPPFTLMAGAVVDEGNNWVNLQWGPLAIASPATGQVMNDPSLSVDSPAIDYVPSTSPTFALAPTQDFYGNPRPDPANPTKYDVGAIEYQLPPPVLNSIAPNSGFRGYSVPVTLTGKGFAAGGAVTLKAPASITASNVAVVNDTQVTATLNIGNTATLGANQIRLLVGKAQSNTLAHTVTNPPAPTLVSITPATSTRGVTVPVTITGTNLLTVSAISVSGDGISVTGVTAVNDSTVTANFAIANTAGRNARTVTVTTLGGSSTIGFNVVQPTLSSITPASGTRGSSVPVTLTGTNLRNATGLAGLGIGVTIADGSFSANDSTVTATLTIAPKAPIGARNLAVIVPGGNTGTVAFNVKVPQSPTLASISPASGLRGVPVNVTLTGSNFTSTGTTISAGAGITVSNLVVVSSTTITARFATAANAAPGARNVSVTTPGGISGAVAYTVTAPTINSINPGTGFRGTTVPVTLTGTDLLSTTAITVSGGGVSVTNMKVVNDSTVTANFVIGPNASVSTRNVAVTTTSAGTSAVVNFTINNPPPATINSISPAGGVRSSAVPVTLTGTNFTSGSTVSAGLNITVGALTFSPDGTQISTTFTIGSGAATGPRNITVTNSSGTASGPATFTVTAGTPGFSLPTLTTTPANTLTKSGTVTVTNSASVNAGPLTLTAAPTITKTAGAGTFSITAGGTCASGLVLNPGASCTINVQYAPGTSLALATAHVTITDSGSSTGTTTQNSPNFNGN